MQSKMLNIASFSVGSLGSSCYYQVFATVLLLALRRGGVGRGWGGGLQLTLAFQYCMQSTSSLIFHLMGNSTSGWFLVV